MSKITLMDKAIMLLKKNYVSRAFSENTVTRKFCEIDRFHTYLEDEIQKVDLREITAIDIEDYILYLKNEGFSPTTQIIARTMLKELFYLLTSHDLILKNPMGKLLISTLKKKQG